MGTYFKLTNISRLLNTYLCREWSLRVNAYSKAVQARRQASSSAGAADMSPPAWAAASGTCPEASEVAGDRWPLPEKLHRLPSRGWL